MMESAVLPQIQWYRDTAAASRGEPGIRHSYVASLATVLAHRTGELDPVHLMGATAFAFRICINQTFCPSAISMFDWDRILPEAVEQSGHQCRHIARYWGQDDIESQRRQEAHDAIITALDAGTPVVCWDVHDGEWGVLTGYSNHDRSYQAMDANADSCELPYDRLGRNGIDILSVIIPGPPNKRTPSEVHRNAIRAAVAHADQREPLDRSDYQDGLPAFDLWATMCERWAMIIDAGCADHIATDIQCFADCYARHYQSARCYARDYLARLAADDPSLSAAADHYRRVAELLTAVAGHFAEPDIPRDADGLRQIGEVIRSAARLEKHGIAELRAYVSAVK